MDNKFKKVNFIFLLTVLLSMCLFFVHNQVITAVTDDDVEINDSGDEKTEENLEAYLNKEIHSNDKKYNSLISNPKKFPFDTNITNLKLISLKKDAFVSKVFDETDYPTVLLEKAQDFTLELSLEDFTDQSIFYQWSTDEKLQDQIIAEKYSLVHDEWGKNQKGNNKETIILNGSEFSVGEIGTGAIVVQTSFDGENWQLDDKGKFENGVYTTDVLDNYHGSSINYTPDGDLLKQGVFISVSFLYEIRYDYEIYRKILWNKKETVYYNVIESYKFFVVEDNPNVVTFNNLTVVNQLDKNGSNEQDVEIIQNENYLENTLDSVTNTMCDGDLTTTGFRINVTANPHLSIKVKRNFLDYDLGEMIEFEGQKYYEILSQGRYQITVESYTKKETLTIYVDNANEEVVYQRYFGNDIIYNGMVYGNDFLNYSPNNKYNNKRIYDENSDVPVFYGPLSFDLKTTVSNIFLFLKGIAKNLSTGEIYIIDSHQFTLESNGLYEVILTTSEDYYQNNLLGNNVDISGDVRVYRYKFQIVSSDGSPTINSQLLSGKDFNNLSIIAPSDYKPKFYGVTRNSSNKGKIIIAFADKESASEYALAVAMSQIESYEDSKGKKYWKIPNLENLSGAKITSNSGWLNAKTVNALAKMMVEEHYFDMTMHASYLTLQKNSVEIEQEGIKFENLQNFALNKSIVIWYNEEHRQNSLCEKNTVDGKEIKAYIGKKNTAILNKDENNIYSKIDEQVVDYMYVKDMLGIDSNKIILTDTNNIEYSIEYNKGLYNQLKELKLNSGVYLITEYNIYNDIVAQYNIYYVEDGYQPVEMNLEANGNKIQICSGHNFDGVSLKNVIIKNIDNVVDPYSYVRITIKDTEKYYEIEDVIGMEFVENGEYEIAIIDRFGNNVTFEFTIK